MLVLFVILALGSWLGHLSVKRFSLGPAGVFFVALVFGHFGLTVPRAIMDLGLLLFVYAVGLRPGRASSARSGDRAANSSQSPPWPC